MSTKKKKFQYLRKKFPKTMQKKLVMLFMAIILAFVVLVGRITYINAFNGKQYTKTVLDQRQYDSRTIPFKRGDILDTNGTKLATSERVYNVILDAKVMLSKEEYLEPTKSVLKDCFGIEESAVDKVVAERPEGRYNILAKKVTYEQAQVFYKIEKDKKKSLNIKGVWLEEDYIRSYPYNTLACDVIGFTVDGNVGNGGLEASYNSILNGTDGREYGYLDEDASLERIVKEAANGHNIVTTIDANLQAIIEKHIQSFNEAHKNEARPGEGSKNTAVLVMNPNTGEILAMASYPNYNLNTPRELNAYFTEEELATMTPEVKLDKLNQLWRNFCVSDTFEPGSTIKPFTLATGLECGALTGEENYYCDGFLHVGDHDIKCHITSGHGAETSKGAIADSCNVALMQMASAIGPEEFVKYQHIFGFGESTGIDLPGEAATSALMYRVDNMDSASLATNSFGQNFNVTMTQLAAGFCSLINNGKYYEPHIVKQIEDEKGAIIENINPILVKKTITENTGKILKEDMLAVVQEGTGKKAAVEGYDVGGKTGTAEKLPRGGAESLISFIGYAPQENPEIVVYTVIDEPNTTPQSNTSLVTQLSADIMTEIFPYLNITKSAE
ncbi:MAG: penicillin-binding protein 2 [Lachnospiraceae bacterium]